MDITIEVNDETAAYLTDLAADRGLTVEEAAHGLLMLAVGKSAADHAERQREFATQNQQIDFARRIGLI